MVKIFSDMLKFKKIRQENDLIDRIAMSIVKYLWLRKKK